MSTLYLDIEAAPGGRLVLAADGTEKAIYGLADALQVDGTSVEPRQLAVLEQNGPSEIVAPQKRDNGRCCWDDAARLERNKS